MITTERQQLIDKVQALLSKADNTTFEAEAEAFRDKAAELMAKHNITMHDTTAPQFQAKEYDEQVPLHDQHLRNAVARFNGVFLVRTRLGYGYGQKAYSVKVIGTLADIEAYEYMLSVVHRQRNSAFIKYVDDKVAKGDPPTAKEREEFYLGFAYGVNNKVDSLLKAQNTKISEWGLVPVDNRKSAEAWYTADNKVRQSRPTTAKYQYAGVEAGRNVNLNKGVTSSNGKHLALGM